MRVAQVAGAIAAIALSSLGASGESPQVAAVSGRDQLALHDLATGAELARFDAAGGSSDLIALGSGVALSNHTAGNEVILVDLKRRTEIGRLPSSSLGGVRPVHMYLSPAKRSGNTSSFSTTEMNAAHPRASAQRIRRCC